MVRDPNFWRRFSIAVHQDDEAKQEMTQRPEMKHSYVTTTSTSTTSHPASPSLLTSPLRSPTSQSPIHPPPRNPTRPKRTRSRLQKTPSTKPLLRPSIQLTREVIAEAHLPSPTPLSPLSPAFEPITSAPLHSPTNPTSPRSPTPRHCSSPYHTRTPNFSSLSLTGRPPSRFRFWTTITADANPPPRTSWLEQQKRKSKQRMWICWAFWGVLGIVVAGVVVAVLVLRAHGII